MSALMSVHVKFPHKIIDEIDLIIHLNLFQDFSNRSEFIRSAVREKINHCRKDIIPLAMEKKRKESKEIR